MNTIPRNYISCRWCKNPLPNHLRGKRHRYNPYIEESEVLATEIYSTVEDCINILRNDPDKLRVFLSKVKDLKKDLEIDAPSQNAPQNKDALYEDLLGVKAPVRVSIKNPKKCPNKSHRRFKGAAEKGKAIKKARINRKVPFKPRECSKCGQVGHNRRTCDKKKIDDADYAANKQAYREAHKRAYEEANKLASEEVNESDEEEGVNESEEDYDVDEDDELDEDDTNDGYDEDEGDA
ncbi:FAR1 DNA binding domain-containing protein [Tanacetum coccineum]|uniref:FAR1 DNA binding domain-containing protein n=1 Tax=Tanacetum coccineum TaxID=301880 RepID=A0ABQ5H6G6_9ASTR